ncbi:angiopoietin-1-like [Ptychodera flava]|uniref:angiopoietin-1-like n=1 Tax=Ptychodera flava TaxID=63121 RepID=UPI00396A309E
MLQFSKNQIRLYNGEDWMLMYDTKPGTITQPGKSCKDLYTCGVRESGQYWIYPDSNVKQATKVYCEMDFNGGGWTRVFNMMTRPDSDSSGAEFYQSIIRNDDIRFVAAN